MDCVFIYECPYTGKHYILIARNVLHVMTMDHDLVPPFLLQEAGLLVNAVPKIHVKDPDVTHHSLYFEEADLCIPLALWGVFSYFPTRRPTTQELQSDEQDVLFLTPDGPWDSHSDVYDRSEENTVDWDGEISEPAQWP
jgi:hypothetical protein